MSLMEYVSTKPDGAGKYHGAVAQGYDTKREHDDKWKIEQRIIEDMLDFPADTVVLDVPCGTGRFFECYAKRRFNVVGVDISDEMLNEAVKKIKKYELTFRSIRLGVGDVRKLQFDDKTVDVAVMCRLTRWLSPEDCKTAFKELQRVSRKRIIFTARVRNHPHARTYELIKSALNGWKIARDEPGVDLDYRIIALEPV